MGTGGTWLLLLFCLAHEVCGGRWCFSFVVSPPLSKVLSPFNFFLFVLLVNGEEVCGCFSFDLTPFSPGRKEVHKDTLNKSERKTGVGTQNIDVSIFFLF